MKVLTVVLSYNTPARTIRCFNELCILKPDWHDVIILDNSRKDLIPYTPRTVWIGEQNVGHGGMLDHAIRKLPTLKYDFVGLINNDTYDYAPRFIEKLMAHANERTGIISPSIKPGGSVWPTMLHDDKDSRVRDTNFVETIAPWYSRELFKAMAQLCPMEYFGYIDRAVSICSKRCGFNNTIVNELAITHEAGIGRKEVGTYDDFCARSRDSIAAWYAATPAVRGLENVWPEEINATDWKLKKGPNEGSTGTETAVRP